MKRYLTGFLLLLAVICGLSACGKNDEKQEELKDGEYYIYYANQTYTKLRTEVCQTDERGIPVIADILLKTMQTPPQNI